ncbi:hypothetical protein NB709_003764 [Xanthomonas sacchari]|uniref:bifunctional isocitrate dehydrogenase kinase/phosphatase n=1 Tax=Xanthomonas sacchari TaxID=56458 RepID=UPI002255C19C|nr:bifunctional isocitrate dehydrogenase kinase/phosphatase [Xanthomonas sacchari]MCW0413888.1 hypothetical protein [Xanthomonas sacchari]
MVFHLDRVGRLLDAQSYRSLRFPSALLQELMDGCARILREDDYPDAPPYPDALRLA